MICMCHPQTCLGVGFARIDMLSKTDHHKKCRRYDIAGHAHELTFSCFRRQPFLSDDRFCTFLGEAVGRAMTIHRCELWAYVFMPEHVHLLVHPKEPEYSISRILHSIKQSSARKVLIYARRLSPGFLSAMETGQRHTPYRFWQDGGGFDRNVITSSALVSIVKYIHANPVRRGLVIRPEDWPWSSARDWAGLGPNLIAVDMDSFPSG